MGKKLDILLFRLQEIERLELLPTPVIVTTPTRRHRRRRAVTIITSMRTTTATTGTAAATDAATSSLVWAPILLQPLHVAYTEWTYSIFNNTYIAVSL